jgi:transcriptional regulator with XRE-family HTH domain
MFFDRLEKACFDKKISVSRLLRELGFSTSSVTYWGKGSMPKIDKLVKISEYLDVPINYLIEGETQGAFYGSDTGREYARTGESCGSRSSITDRELGRLEGRIEELEKKNAEYKEIIETRDNQLRDVIDKIAGQIEKIPKHS